MVFLVDVISAFIRRKCRLKAVERDCFGTNSRHGDLVGVTLARDDAVRAGVRRRKARLDASSAYKYVRRRSKSCWNMDVRRAMSGCVDWLEPGYLEAHLVQRRRALLTLLRLFEWGIAEQGTGDR